MTGSSCTPESGNGTSVLSVSFKSPDQYEIGLDTGSYILTDLTTSFLRGWLGYHNQQSLSSVLEQLFVLAENFPGSSFSCRYTTQWYSKSLTTARLHRHLQLLEELSTLQFRTTTSSESPGASR